MTGTRCSTTHCFCRFPYSILVWIIDAYSLLFNTLPGKEARPTINAASIPASRTKPRIDRPTHNGVNGQQHLHLNERKTFNDFIWQNEVEQSYIEPVDFVLLVLGFMS